MAKIADPVMRDGPSPREVGRTLRQVRRTQGLTRAEVARSAGLTRRELAAYERGRSDVPDSDLWCLAGSCGVEVTDLSPEHAPRTIGSGLVDFFSMPRAEDPFSPPPALDPPIAGRRPMDPDTADVAAIAWVAQDGSHAAANGPVGGRSRQGGSAWRVGGIFPATTTADSSVRTHRRPDARWALADRDAPGDFTVETTVDFTAGAGFGILFRATVDEHERISGYSFDIDPMTRGGYLVREWEYNRQHGRPLAHASVTDPSRLYGRHTLRVTLTGDLLTATVDRDTVLTLPDLSRASIELGREPCRGGGIGVQAWATAEVTIDTFRVAPA